MADIKKRKEYTIEVEEDSILLDPNKIRNDEFNSQLNELVEKLIYGKEGAEKRKLNRKSNEAFDKSIKELKESDDG